MNNKTADDFNWIAYLLNNPDLRKGGIINKKLARQHWNNSGKREGRGYKQSLIGIPQQKILVLGMAKTGTSTISLKIKNSIKAHYIAEPKEFLPPSEDRHTVAKVHINHFKRGSDELEQYAQAYDKKILLVRDPRDRMISSAFYTQRSEEDTKKFYRCVLRKEKEPNSVSLFQNDTSQSYKQFMPENVRNVCRAIELFYEENSDFFILRYEDFIRGNLEALEAYLGFSLTGSGDFEQDTNYVKRSATLDQWKDNFTPEDVDLYRPVLDKFLMQFGYDPDWELNKTPSIDPETGSQYLERKFQNVLLPSQNDNQTLKHG